METRFPGFQAGGFGLAILLIVSLVCGAAIRAHSKEKVQPIDPNEPTNRLFQLLDSSYGGKLADFYFLIPQAYRDPQNPEKERQNVLLADYEKDRPFGRLTVHVRTVDKLTPEQLRIYSPKQIYEFGEADTEKFIKTNPGPFGRPGDNYLRAVGDRPLASTPITDEVRKSYELILTQYVLPALQKK